MSTASPNQMPLVAVITPCYNGERHVEAAIKAVQAQTYRPLVHCIVDNASTDGTAEIIARYASADVPIVTIRNPETITFQQNSNKVASLIPAEATHFRMLHADDTMPANAIADMMDAALSDETIIMVAGIEKMNGVLRPHYFPPECTVFEANNMLARWMSDEAHIPTAHVLFRADVMRKDEDFYPNDIVECYIAAVCRTLSRGKRAAFVHKYIADTIRHKDSGSLVFTLAPKVKAVIWEKLLFIERYGPASLSNTEYKRVLNRFLRVFYRRILFWAISGSGAIAKRDLERLASRGHRPSVFDFIASVLVWPYYLFLKRVKRPYEPPRWPTDATTAAS
ncbi:MAG: glycosyltransferase family 2 protein [Hyphomonadaceae bacterium]|nr:glycosyltransferase family 2 protein [Hyphomonadaceae bacterium]MCA8885476.1 glycosyltransferase family 2 protein [Hyphomonadaceae bacterium]